MTPVSSEIWFRCLENDVGNLYKLLIWNKLNYQNYGLEFVHNMNMTALTIEKPLTIYKTYKMHVINWI